MRLMGGGYRHPLCGPCPLLGGINHFVLSGVTVPLPATAVGGLAMQGFRQGTKR